MNNTMMDDDPYRAPRAGHQGGGHIVYEDVQVFSLTQRLNRLRFACYSLTAWVLLALLSVLLVVLLSAVLTGKALSLAMSVVFILVGIFALVYFIGLVVRRLHDVGKSGWWFLVFFTPLAAIPLMIVMPTAGLLLLVVQLVSPLFSLYLMVAAGESMNRFGTPNPPNSFLVSFFGGICWAVSVLVLLLQIAIVTAQYVAPEKVEKYLGHSQSDIKQFEQLFEQFKRK